MGNALFASCLPDTQDSAIQEAAQNVPISSSSTSLQSSSYSSSSPAIVPPSGGSTGGVAAPFSTLPPSPPSSPTQPSSGGINVRRAPSAAPVPRPQGHERAETPGAPPKPAAKPQPPQQPPKKVEEDVDYFQDMEPTYVRPTIIHKPTTKPQASRLTVDADPSWEDDTEGAWDEDDGLE